MATIDWLPTSGEHDWNDPASWQGGVVPGSADIASVRVDGTVQIDVDSAVDVAEITLKTKRVNETLHLAESASGSITTRRFEVGTRCTVTLDAVNHFTATSLVYESLVQLGVNDALGTRPIDDNIGQIEATANVTARNAINVDWAGIFGADNGDTLTLSGALTMSGHPGEEGEFLFGGYPSEPRYSGTVVVASKTFERIDTSIPNAVTVSLGTLSSGSGPHAQGLLALFAQSDMIAVQGHAVLDVSKMGRDITLPGLTGVGTVQGGKGWQTLHISDATWQGALNGKFVLDFSGANSFKTAFAGDQQITMAGGADHLDLSQVTGTYTVSADPSAEVEVIASLNATNRFVDFQDGHVVVDAVVASVTFTERDGLVRANIHPQRNSNEGLYYIYFYGVSSRDEIHIGGTSDGHYTQFSYQAPGETPPHEGNAAMDHAVAAAAAEHAAAHAVMGDVLF